MGSICPASRLNRQYACRTCSEVPIAELRYRVPDSSTTEYLPIVMHTPVRGVTRGYIPDQCHLQVNLADPEIVLPKRYNAYIPARTKS